MSKTYEARKYQLKTVENFKTWLFSEEKHASIILPTGTGKTVTAALCLKEAVGKKIIWVAHREELVDQGYQALSQIMPDKKISIELAEKKGDPTADIVVGSVQTLARERKHLEGFVPDIIVIDELHHFSKDNIQYYGLLERWPNAKVMGMTATAFRSNGEDLPLGRVLIQMDVGTAVDKGYLVTPKPEPLITDISLANVKTKMGDFALKELSQTVNVDRRNKLIVERIVKLVKKEHRQGLLFAVDIEHSKAMFNLLKDHVRVAEVYGDTPAEERRKIISQIRNREIDVVTNMGVLIEGFDAPHLSFVVMARPTKSLGLFTQCLDEKTEILSERGWVGMNDVLESDKIYAMDTNTNLIHLKPIINIYKRDLGPDEKMYEVLSPSLDLRVTGGHRMVYRTRSASRRGKFNWKIDDCEHLFSVKDQYEIPVSGLENSSGIPLTDDEIRFIGWFLTDGTLNKKTNGITITQAVHQPWLSEIDKCIQGCGFKYSRYEIIPKSNFTSNPSKQIKFHISKGPPRQKDKHLTGWARLEKYIDKNLSLELENISVRQFEILLEAIHLGNGSKQINNEWVRRSYHISSGNKIFTERLQSLCIRRGFRCNVSSVKRDNSIFYTINIKKSFTRMVGSLGTSDRPKLQLSKTHTVEKVWCAENELGTLIIRRNGKTAIVGNCVGRGLRPYEGKTDCIIVDVYDKVKVRQSRITFNDLARHGDLYGYRKRAKNILKAPVPVDEISQRLKHFPVMINKSNDERWTVDEESFSLSSWGVSHDQWIVTWSAESQQAKIVSRAVYVPWTEVPPTNVNLSGREVQHPTFGNGRVIAITDRQAKKVLVQFGRDQKLMEMERLQIQKFIKEFSPTETESTKTERLFFICLPEQEDKGRVLSFVKKGRDLILQEDVSLNKFETDAYLQNEAMKDGVLHLVRTNAKWKGSPASDKQKNFVLTLMPRIGFDIDLGDLSKGEASSIIEQIKWVNLINQKFGADYREQLIGYQKEEDI